MDGLLSTLWTRRFCTGLLHALVCAVLGFPFPAAAHVGIHEEIETLSRLIRRGPATPQLYVSRGEAYRLHGNWDSATTDFSKALDLDRGNVAATTGLGRIYIAQDNPRQAIVQLNRALAREAGNVRALTSRAQAHADIGKPLIAAADYTRAIEQFRGGRKPLPVYYLERARAYAAAGDRHIDVALEGLDEGISVLGSIRILELYAVELEIRRGSVDAALARLDNILAGAARKEFLLIQRGDIQSAVGRKAAAEKDYRAALAGIGALPPRWRHTPSVRQLEADLDARLEQPGLRSDAK